MPAPASYIDIDAIPFSRVVTQAEFNVANEIWFRYVAATPIVIGLQTNSGGTFTPITGIYDSTGTVLRSNVTGIKGQYYALTSISTYYIKITRSGGGASDFDFTFTADTKDLDIGAPASGEILINDDASTPPTAWLSAAGAVQGYFSAIPGGEMGAILDNNVSFWHDRFERYSAVNHIAVFDANLTYLTSVNCNLLGTINFPKFGVDNTNSKVYVVNQWDELWTISDTGVATDTGYVFPSGSPQAIAISPDGTKLYWVEKQTDGIIHVLQLSDFTDLTDLYTIPGFTTGDKVATTFNGHPGDMFCMADGSVITWWYDDSAASWNLIHISSAGALLSSYTLTGTYQMDHLAYIAGETDYIYVWFFVDNTGEVGYFAKYQLSTQTFSNSFTLPMYSEGVNLDIADTTKFGASNSCTFVLLQNSIVAGGTIQVIKVSVPDGLTQSFDFTTTGGLSPSTFSLTPGQTQTFLNVPAGTYGVSETADDRYDTAYSVSNGDPHTAIVLGAGETVVVTVTNTLLSAIGGGIYKITPGKRNDTLWNANGAGTTDVKIPDPYGITGYIGD